MRALTVALGIVLLGVSRLVAAAPVAAPAVPATAAATQPAAIPTAIAITTVIEDGKPQLVATVTAAGKPVEGAKVAFFAPRTFGELKLGEETTLDDGTAAVPFPQGLPGGASGELRITARIVAPAFYAGGNGTATLPGGTVIEPEADPFPRAIWAPHAPLPLLLTLLTLLGAVWATYAFVFRQLWKIRQGATS